MHFAEIAKTLLIICLICSPLLAMGIALFWSVKSGRIPAWLDWWRPMTKRLLSYDVDERYTKSERMQVDGIVIVGFGIFLIVEFSLFYFLQVVFTVIGERTAAIMFLILLAASKKVVEKFSVMILKTRKMLKEKN